MPVFLFVVACIVCVWIVVRNRANVRQVIARKSHKKQKKERGETLIMMNLLQTMLGKHCLVHTIDNDYDGTMEKVENDCILMKDRHSGALVFVNPEYVVGIVECKKKEKKSKKAKKTAATN